MSWILYGTAARPDGSSPRWQCVADIDRSWPGKVLVHSVHWLNASGCPGWPWTSTTTAECSSWSARRRRPSQNDEIAG